jgi:hypothetical protein
MNSQNSLAAMQLDPIETLSQTLRSLLWKITPELVSTAESFASQVLYIPMSATGCSPECDPKTGAFGFRPKDVKPLWAEVPLLYSMSRWMQGMVHYRKKNAGAEKPAGADRHSSWTDSPNSHPSRPTADERR